MKPRTRNLRICEPCIYCGSRTVPSKREHVMSRALGSFDQNWTLDCVCDECNQYFADKLELALGRDSREALLRLDLGLKPATEASKLLNRRVRSRVQDPGQFDGTRLVLAPSKDGNEVVPAAVPQVGLRRPGESWHFLTEKELTPENLQPYMDSSLEIEIGIFGRHGVAGECDRLIERLATFGIDFIESRRALDQPITAEPSLRVVHEINVDETIIRAACKIGFNYAAKVLGAATMRRISFDAARRFVRYGEAPVRIATVQQRSILTGAGAESSRTHACGLGWDSGYLVVVVSLFNEITYGLRLCAAEAGEFPEARHFFDPLTRTISAAGIAS